jgi:hypothetical protein
MIVMFLVYGDRKAIAMLSREERGRLVERHIRDNRDVLADRATVLATRGCEAMPAAPDVLSDAGGALAGCYLVDCRDMDDAIELARAYTVPDGVGCIELRSVLHTWDYASSIDSPAAVDTLWRLYSDVATWPRWKVGIRHAELDGPFETGVHGWLIPAGQAPMSFHIAEAKEKERYISETELAGEVTLRMEHYLTPLPGGGTRMTHRATIPRAAQDTIGLNYCPDFDYGIRATLRRLSALAAEPDATAA